ncbi:cuticle protein 16.8 [Anopheles ziemanni]|uniref:cuticle protein 16.8 n=1 Tax=Anopheles coustani TaxID=139045 RepID=UPI00265938CC|nr:cuticle protein 16.8 [Anopheles coustani]XP_058175962.1 cuticle protein 16.8 [Anopheles ziemanni]
MFRFILLSTLLVAATAQYNGGYHRDPKTAAILSEQRYLSGDGKFGAAYTQEDGTDFKEETDADGNRRGSYSYVDPTGQRRTISYVAGKNGFQASGDHLPVAPPAPPQAAPQPSYQPQQSYAAPAQQYDSGRSYDINNGEYDPRWNDPNFSQQQTQYQAPAPAPAPVHNYHHAPAPVAPVPQYNQHNYAPAPAPQAPAWTSTPAPHRFQPPGKLQLNRTPDGYSYTFNKV